MLKNKEIKSSNHFIIRQTELNKCRIVPFEKLEKNWLYFVDGCTLLTHVFKERATEVRKVLKRKRSTTYTKDLRTNCWNKNLIRDITARIWEANNKKVGYDCRILAAHCAVTFLFCSAQLSKFRIFL